MNKFLEISKYIAFFTIIAYFVYFTQKIDNENILLRVESDKRASIDSLILKNSLKIDSLFIIEKAIKQQRNDLQKDIDSLNTIVGDLPNL